MNIPWSTVKMIINKWKVYGTTKTLPRSGHHSKLEDWASRTSERLPRVQWKLWKSYRLLWLRLVTVCMWQQYPKQSTNLTCMVGWQEGSHYSRKPTLNPAWSVQNNHSGNSVAMWEKVLWFDVTKIELFCLNAVLGLAQTQHGTSLQWSMVVAASCYGDVSQLSG